MKLKQRLNIVIATALAVSFPAQAWALQSHGAPEGNYVHQMAHLLFMGALCYLYWHTRRTQELSSKGWKYLQIFCFIFACWNLLAFVGHEAFGLLSPEDFIDKNSWGERLAPPISFLKTIYFLTKMDHLLFVPALLALVVSLRSFYLDALEEEQH